MSTKTDYNDAEWKAVTAAPVAAGLLITLSDASGPLGIAKEAMAVGKAIADSATSDVPDVVKAIAETAKAGTRPELPDVPSGDRAKTRDTLLALIRTAVGAVEARSPAEAQGYKVWLSSVATKVAQAAKEGGFLGFGGTVVSSDEQAALKQLADVLGVSPS